MPVASRFSSLTERLQQQGYGPGSIDSMLLDLGVSSLQVVPGKRTAKLVCGGLLTLASSVWLRAASLSSTTAPSTCAWTLR
jgi:hypothetical protein